VISKRPIFKGTHREERWHKNPVRSTMVLEIRSRRMERERKDVPHLGMARMKSING
jgi:hypothetical protein